MKILFVSSEIAPYSKTGGLADVARALPKAIRAMGHDIRNIMPKYPSVDKADATLKPVGSFPVPMHYGSATAGLHTSENGGVPTFFVENKVYFNRNGNYGIGNWDYPDNLERFVFFCKAALEYCIADGFCPDIIHCNEWQTAPLPAILKVIYQQQRQEAAFSGLQAVVFSIHNSAYQGIFPTSQYPILTLPWQYYHNDFEYYDQINLMKSAVIHADVIHTVSETYAREIQETEFGFGLQGVFRQRSADLHGILNGVDYDEWNPAVDAHAYGIHYSEKKLNGKSAIRSRLRREYGLPGRKDIPLIGITSRLVAQKGIDLVTACAEGILHLGAQLIVLGDGEPRYHDFFEWLLRQYPDQVRVYIGYNNDLAHKIIAGADLFLMPSHFEPCGLTQIYSLKYGTLPVVRLTGGLADTIRDSVNGFTFFDYHPHEFYETVKRALRVFKHDKKQWRRMMLTAMAQDFSWQRSAEKILDMYQKA